MQSELENATEKLSNMLESEDVILNPEPPTLDPNP